MSVNITDVLDLPAFKLAGAQVVGAPTEVHRVVRWVIGSEELDIAESLKGGELLLTTGASLGYEPYVHERYVAGLAQHSLAGLVVILGHAFRSLPQSLVDACNRHQLPLVEAPRRVSWVEAALQVHEAIIARQLDLISVSEGLSRELTGLISSGASLRAILKRVAERAGNPVVLADRFGHIVDLGTHVTGEGEVLRLWKQHQREPHDHLDAGQLAVVDSSPQCVWGPVGYGGVQAGSIHALACDHPISDRTKLVLGQSLAVVASDLRHRGATEQPRLLGKATLLRDLLEGTFTSLQGLYERAQALGVDMHGESLAVLVCGLSDFSSSRVTRAGGPRPAIPVRVLSHAVLRKVEAALASEGVQGLYELSAAQLVIVLSIAKRKAYRQTCSRIAAKLKSSIESDGVGGVLVVGVSGPVDVSSASYGLHQAQEAHAFSSERVESEATVFYQDLGAIRLLSRLRTDHELSEYVADELNAVLTLDEEAESPLLSTLVAYVENGGRKEVTAKALGINRRTLYARLERLSALLNRNLEDGEQCHRLWLALRALEVLRSSSPAYESGPDRKF